MPPKASTTKGPTWELPACKHTLPIHYDHERSALTQDQPTHHNEEGLAPKKIRTTKVTTETNQDHLTSATRAKDSEIPPVDEIMNAEPDNIIEIEDNLDGAGEEAVDEISDEEKLSE